MIAMNDELSISRRTLLLGVAAGSTGLVSGVLPFAPLLAASGLTVGFIYVGPKDDYGYNQAHAEGAAMLKKMPGVKIVEEEQVPETDRRPEDHGEHDQAGRREAALPDLLRLFRPVHAQVAKKYPDVTFLHCGGLWQEGKTRRMPAPISAISTRREYLSGIVAGHSTKSQEARLRRRQADPAGAAQRQRLHPRRPVGRSVRSPRQVIFTGDWSMPVKEAEATNSLIDQGVDVVTCHVDSPKVVIETAEKRGIFTCGYHASQAVLAPKGYLTGAEWNWQKVYTDSWPM